MPEAPTYRRIWRRLAEPDLPVEGARNLHLRARNRTASHTSCSTSPRDRYGDNNTRISRPPFPQIWTSADDSAATVSPQAPSSSPDGGAQREAQPAARFAGLAPFNSFRSSRKVLAHFSMSFSKTWRRITLIRRALLRGESFMAPRMRSLRPLMS